MDDAAEIERRLNAGEWLTPGEVGVLFGRDRTTIHRWLQQGWARTRKSFGGHRVTNPDDVQLRLTEWREEHDDSPPADG